MPYPSLFAHGLPPYDTRMTLSRPQRVHVSLDVHPLFGALGVFMFKRTFAFVVRWALFESYLKGCQIMALAAASISAFPIPGIVCAFNPIC